MPSPHRRQPIASAGVPVIIATSLLALRENLSLPIYYVGPVHASIPL
jgi:hypothetical protein